LAPPGVDIRFCRVAESGSSGLSISLVQWFCFIGLQAMCQYEAKAMPWVSAK